MNDTTVEPHRGALILVFGILGFVPCFLFGIVAWIMGKGDLDKMAAGTMDSKGHGLTKAGITLGIIAAALNILVLVGAAMLVLGDGGLGQAPVQ